MFFETKREVHTRTVLVSCDTRTHIYRETERIWHIVDGSRACTHPERQLGSAQPFHLGRGGSPRSSVPPMKVEPSLSDQLSSWAFAVKRRSLTVTCQNGSRPWVLSEVALVSTPAPSHSDSANRPTLRQHTASSSLFRGETEKSPGAAEDYRLQWRRQGWYLFDPPPPSPPLSTSVSCQNMTNT